MYILGLSVFELTFTLVLILMIFVGLIGLKIRREQLLSDRKTISKKDIIEAKSEYKRIKQEDDDLAALMFNTDDEYND